MKLADLEPQFMRYELRETPDGPREHHIDVASLAEAQGITFLCPLCFQKHAGDVDTHAINVTFADRGVAPGLGSEGVNGNGERYPTRWGVSGSGYGDLTLTPSIDLSKNKGGCAWHGFVTNGEAA